MKCPIDNIDLQMTDRQGIEIDYCPQCRGVWLDRGELDKIIERNTQAPVRPVQEPRYQEHPYPQGDRYHGKHKREGFLGDLFDF
ncbi:MAG TPA: zf-TFIIB domain-containing protein [Candidatus Paceibacterota bacterium]|nr:zf-TFIIB domain-containing protein [Candidatus Paceibacterota bacterium]